jgi:hypothetical protein
MVGPGEKKRWDNLSSVCRSIYSKKSDNFYHKLLICQTSPVCAAQAKECILGPLSKCRRVGAGPVPGREELELPELETLVVSNTAGLLWPKSVRN